MLMGGEGEKRGRRGILGVNLDCIGQTFKAEAMLALPDMRRCAVASRIRISLFHRGICWHNS